MDEEIRCPASDSGVLEQTLTDKNYLAKTAMKDYLLSLNFYLESFNENNASFCHIEDICLRCLFMRSRKVIADGHIRLYCYIRVQQLTAHQCTSLIRIFSVMHYKAA
jgi:hypothetical protein